MERSQNNVCLIYTLKISEGISYKVHHLEVIRGLAFRLVRANSPDNGHLNIRIVLVGQ